MPEHDLPAGANDQPPASMTWTSFDRYARYSAIVRAVRANLGEGHHRVLDVGDAAGHLHAFDPSLQVIGLDLHPAEQRLPGAVPVHADGTALPFPDASFDAVVSSDVLEHVPAEGRAAFLREMQRVSRGLVVVAAPFDTTGVAGAEDVARRYALLALGAAQPQLDEHHANGLPTLDATTAALAGGGAEVATIGNGNLWDWLTFMLLRFQVEARPALVPLIDGYDIFYNSTLTERSDVGPFYRHLVIARTDGAPLTGGPAGDPVVEPAPAALFTTFMAANGTEVTRQDNVPSLDGLTAELAGARAELRELRAQLADTSNRLSVMVHRTAHIGPPLHRRVLNRMPRTKQRLIQVRAAARALLDG